MSELFREIMSSIKEIFSIVHWFSTLALIAGVAAAAGSFEETTRFMVLELIVPSILINVLTGFLMEILETRVPSIYRLFKKVLG